MGCQCTKSTENKIMDLETANAPPKLEIADVRI